MKKSLNTCNESSNLLNETSPKLNKNLHLAKAAKDDEFYTKIEDIENELYYYKQHFKNKVVYCNCDDAEWSNFFIYFKNNFKFLGLKKLISTHYSKDIANDKAYKLECVSYISDKDGLPIPKKIELNGDGDFRSPECIEFLKECDIVCTNPPFSLFREYISQLMEYDKQFLIIGNTNAITYKETFNFILNGRVWLGNTHAKEFRKPTGEIKKFGNICWFTNLSHKKRNEKIILWKQYSPEEYKQYDNIDAIEVSKTNEIPEEYNGIMGVPITFLEKYNPEQFEIVGNEYTLNIEKGRGYINGKRIYSRIFIKHREK